MPRVKTVYSSKDIPRLWIKGEIKYATNPNRKFYFNEECLYVKHYSSEMIIAKRVTSPYTGETAIVKSRSWTRYIQWTTRQIFEDCIKDYPKIAVNYGYSISKLDNPLEYYEKDIFPTLEDYCRSYNERITSENKEGYFYRSAHSYLNRLIDKWGWAEWYIKFYGLGIEITCPSMSREQFENHKLMNILGDAE